MNLTGNTFDRIQFSPFEQDGLCGQVVFDSRKIGELIHYDNAHLFDQRIIPQEYSAHTVNLIHCTSDISFEEPDKFLNQIVRIPFSGLIVTPFRNNSKGKLESVVIMSKHRKGKSGRRIYLTLYDKYAESLNPDFKGKLRAELKICNRKEIREYLNISSTSLDNVLLSKNNPIYLIINKIKDKIEKKVNCNHLKSSGEARIYEPYFRLFNFNWYRIETDLKLNGISRHKQKKMFIQFLEVQKLMDNFNPNTIFEPLLDATNIVK